MNEAIKLAIEKGGYNTVYTQHDLYKKFVRRQLILDPKFWQALGKALGWGEPTNGAIHWKFEALRYYELVLTGGDTERFWKELLK